MPNIIENINQHVAKELYHITGKLEKRKGKNKKRGVSDAGLRSAVTGGAQMDGFIRLFTKIIVEAGMDERYVFRKRLLELPGFFRPTKEWDLLWSKMDI